MLARFENEIRAVAPDWNVVSRRRLFDDDDRGRRDGAAFADPLHAKRGER